jgi:Tfp pilus assembly protein PilF/lysophospholipase L1-like esterase
MVQRAMLAMLVPMALLVVAEGVLRGLQVGWPATFLLADHIDGQPVWRDNPEYGLVCFAPGEARGPAPFAVPREKDALRVVVMGESAALGDPDPAYGLARMLQAMLEPMYTGRVDVLNAGLTAINSHVMRRIARELPALQPDAVVIYAGHNEVVGPFGPSAVQLPSTRAPQLTMTLRGTRLGQLASGWLTGPGRRRGWTGMRQFLDRQVTEDDPRLAAVYAAWRTNLAETIRLARAAGARTVLCTPGTNLRLPPFASLNRPGLTPEQQAAWQQSFAEGTAAGLGRALEIDDRHALLHYRRGALLEKEGQPDSAYAHLVRARDLDTLRFRADSTIEAAIRSQAAQAEAFVDGEALLGDAGDYYDHVHLSFEGTWKLAREVLKTLAPDHTADAPDLEACARRLAFTRWDRHRLQTEMLNRLRQPPFSLTLPPPPAPTPELAAEADEQYQQAIALAPQDPLLLLNHARLLIEQRRGREAAALLDRVLVRLPQAMEAHWMRGLVAVQQNDLVAAEEAFLRSSGLGRRSRAQAKLDVGTELAAQGRMDEARQWFTQAVAADPDHGYAHYNLGLACSRAGDDEAARASYEQATRLEPGMAEAWNNLGAVHLRQGQPALAEQALVRALALRPDYPTARRNLAAAREALNRGPATAPQDR